MIDFQKIDVFQINFWYKKNHFFREKKYEQECN